MKKIIILLLTITMVMGIMLPVVQADNTQITVTINNQQIQFDQPPVIIDGRTLVPLRAIFEGLGATVDWNGNTQTVTAKRENTTVKITIGDNKLYVNGNTVNLDVPAQIISDRTLVPVRAVSEAFDCEVDWDGNTKTVSIRADISISKLDNEMMKEALNENHDYYKVVNTSFHNFSDIEWYLKNSKYKTSIMNCDVYDCGPLPFVFLKIDGIDNRLLCFCFEVELFEHSEIGESFSSFCVSEVELSDYRETNKGDKLKRGTVTIEEANFSSPAMFRFGLQGIDQNKLFDIYFENGLWPFAFQSNTISFAHYNRYERPDCSYIFVRNLDNFEKNISSEDVRNGIRSINAITSSYEKNSNGYKFDKPDHYEEISFDIKNDEKNQMSLIFTDIDVIYTFIYKWELINGLKFCSNTILSIKNKEKVEKELFFDVSHLKDGTTIYTCVGINEN